MTLTMENSGLKGLMLSNKTSAQKTHSVWATLTLQHPYNYIHFFLLNYLIWIFSHLKLCLATAPHFPVGENYSYFLTLRQHIWKSWCLNIHFMLTNKFRTNTLVLKWPRATGQYETIQFFIIIIIVLKWSDFCCLVLARAPTTSVVQYTKRLISK